MSSIGVRGAITKILEDEGGVADVGDGKGVTRFGQTAAWLSTWGLPVPTTKDDAAANYETWMVRTRLAELADLDAYVGWAVADFAVHSGVVPAVQAFQRAIGVKDDGVIGPKTMARFRDVAGSPLLARKVTAERVRFLGGLLASKAIDRREWARGWMNRVARQIEALP